MVIEDDAELLEEICDILEFEGYLVYRAQSGEEGLITAKMVFPDIILCDIVMPGMNGFDVLNEFKNDESYNLVPFVLITAKTERVHLRLGMDLGADDYIVKPFTRQELINSVDARLKKMKAYKYALNSLKKQIVSSLPHEFRTPLNAILGFSKIIQEDVENYPAQEVSSMAGHIFNSGIDLFRLSQKYLTYIEVMVNKQNFYFDEIADIEKIIHETVFEVAGEYERNDDVETRLINASLNLIDVHFRFALRQLLENAFKFSEKGTPVKIETFQENQRFVIEINDLGVGFPEGTISRVDAFQQFSIGPGVPKGLGLGLFLARQIVKLNHGNLEIFSIPGEGTKILVSVPLYIKESLVFTES